MDISIQIISSLLVLNIWDFRKLWIAGDEHTDAVFRLSARLVILAI